MNATTVDAPGGTVAKVRIGDKEFAANDPNFAKDVGAALTAAGYPGANNPTIVKIPIDPKAGLANFAQMFDIFSAQKLTIIGILTILVIYVTMVYGPIAAALVEFFPTRIRYSGLSLPYHIGNGWFGGLLPATSFAMVAQTGDIYYGLWYPIVVALMTVVIGLLLRARDLQAGHLQAVARSPRSCRGGTGAQDRSGPSTCARLDRSAR